MESKSKWPTRMRLQYINDPELQFRLAVRLCALGAMCFCIMGLLSYLSLIRVAQDHLTHDHSTEVLNQLARPVILYGRADVVVPIFICLVFIFTLGVLWTQRFAGPIFAMRRHLDGLQTGRTRGVIQLRSNDELKDLAASFNAFLEFVYERDRCVSERIEKALGMLAIETDRGAISAQLRNARDLLSTCK